MGIHQVVKVTGERIVLSGIPGLDQLPLRNGALISVQVKIDFYQCFAAQCKTFYRLKNRLGMRFNLE